MVTNDSPGARVDPPRADQIVVLRGASWADYQRVMEMRGDGAIPRVAFLEGLLEIMTPSRDHESIKSVLGRLVEAYCLERDIEFRSVGSWTIENKALGRGVEPDECWVFGPAREATKPDLAIEVVWSSGGIDKLDIYGKLGVREVWYWQKRQITPYVRVGEAYEPRAVSEVLAGIDLAVLASFLESPTTSAAIRGYRETLRSRSRAHDHPSVTTPRSRQRAPDGDARPTRSGTVDAD